MSGTPPTWPGSLRPPDYQPTAGEQCQLGEARACAEAFGTLARAGCAVIVSGMAAVLVWLLYH